MHIVKIELLRVQTYLFAVPRLRVMVGANALLGEAIRVDLPKLAAKEKCKSMRISSDIAEPPKADSNDPLDKCANKEDRDDPSVLYERGILTRDGGHFQAVFGDEPSANEFKRLATDLLAKKLPGLRYEITMKEVPERREPDEKEDEREKPAKAASEISIVDLPLFQVCEESGNGPASRSQQFEGEDPRYFSLDVHQRKKKGEEFFSEEGTKDIVGLFRNKLHLSKMKDPKDLEDLCGTDYLAVIHADGNGIGKRFIAWRDQHKDNGDTESDFLKKEAHGEKFYHSMRVAVRKSLVAALENTFREYSRDEKQVRPYHLLMLGGDDLLLVCRAPYALRFVKEYAKELIQYHLCDGKPLTIGAGVVIASHKFPFHRLHALAEELASSAKRLYRSMDKEVSVVDWMVVTQSWSEDPIDARKRDSIVRYDVDHTSETLLLTGRPYPILKVEGNGEDSLNSLEALLKAADNLKSEDSKAARSQLKGLCYELGKGRISGELIFKELPESTRKALGGVKINEPWKHLDGNTWRTHLLDLVDISEIPHLQMKSQKEGSDQ